MIILHKNTIEKYIGMDTRLDTALQILKEGSVERAGPGRYDDSDILYYIIQRYTTKAKEDARWESHQNWIDIQYIRKGIEQIDVLVTDEGLKETERNDETDVIFYQCTDLPDKIQLSLHAGMLAVFYPEDIHKPCIADGNPQTVEKIVFKIHI